MRFAVLFGSSFTSSDDSDEGALPQHLNNIVRILLEEEEEDLRSSEREDSGDTGRPCLAYLLKQKLITTLCQIAARNVCTACSLLARFGFFIQLPSV